VQDRGLAAYITELVGTLILTFVICTVVVLYVATSPTAQTGSDFAVVGLVHGFVLFTLIASLGAVSGGHFNPAVTFAAAILRRIDPIDAVVYILAQLSGAVLGALLVKGILLDEGRASHYGAAAISPLIAGNFAGACVEGIGTFFLVLAVCAVALNPRARREWAPLSIGLTLGFAVMIFGPLTGAALNPARWFGPALIGNSWGGVWPYLAGPIVGAALAAVFYRFVVAGPQFATGPEPPTTDAEAVENVVADVETAVRPKK
jgi:MIP family channel proteins